MPDLPDHLRRFIADSTWIFAKTYAETWPHEYIVQERVDNASFLELAAHIDTHGYEAEFYSTRQIYFDHEGNTYWHMDNIINRCPASCSPPARGGVATLRGRGGGSRHRKAEGRLPSTDR